MADTKKTAISEGVAPDKPTAPIPARPASAPIPARPATAVANSATSAPATTPAPAATSATPAPAVKSATPAPAAKSAAPAPAAKSATPAPAVTPAAKPAAKKSAPKKKSASKKPAAKSAAKTPEKAPAKKAEPAKAKKVVLDKTDTVKKALWEAHSKTKAQKIESYMAVQVYVHDSEIDSFFIAVQDGAVKIERSHYQGNNGDLIFYGDDTELQKIAKGKYDFIDAISSGKMNYHGDLSVLVALMGLFV